MKYLSILLALLLFVACESANNDTQQPNTPEVNEGENGGEDNGEVDETTTTIHTFTEFNTSAHVIILETNGLRNDYVTFYDTQTGYALYIDFYSPIENEYLPEGTYSLSDGSSMTLDKQYTYFTYYTDGELIRFTEGSAKVKVDLDHESGYPFYEVSARFVTADMEGVKVEYKGQILPQGSIE
ncbi:MAG: hypothetical protein J6Q07_06110 [Alistipes sp.]|nr:hypothetical protein [Alistipes sp.]